MKTFERGCLVRLHTSVWEGRVKLHRDDIKVEADPELIRATKYLVDRECLKPINQARQKSRQYLYNKTLPFPIPGVVFIPKDILEEVDSALTEYQGIFDDRAAEFEKNYDLFMKGAKLRLNGLFNETDYPLNIRSKFAFSWQFFIIGAPGHSSVLSPQIYNREKENFQKTMTEFQEMAVTALRVRFAELIDHMVDRLSGEKKIFRDSMVEHIRTFLCDFEKLNITNDTELSEQVERCRSIVSGVNVYSLRSDDLFRSRIANKMGSIQGDLDQMMVQRPTRKLRFTNKKEPGHETHISS